MNGIVLFVFSDSDLVFAEFTNGWKMEFHLKQYSG